MLKCLCYKSFLQSNENKADIGRKLVTDGKIRMCCADNSKIWRSRLHSPSVGMRCCTSRSSHKNLFLCHSVFFNIFFKEKGNGLDFDLHKQNFRVVPSVLGEQGFREILFF